MNHLTNRLILRILISLCLLAVASRGSAQQSFGGRPQLLGEGTLRTAAAGISLAPDFNPQDLIRKEMWQGGALQYKPYNIGKVVPCSIDFATAAELISSTVETDIYRLEIEMEQTPVGINLYYSDFFIPQGGAPLHIHAWWRPTPRSLHPRDAPSTWSLCLRASEWQ